MQTGTSIIVSVYCKNYDPRDTSLTFIEVNPVRLRIQIHFPSNGSFYKNDLELRGVSLFFISSTFYILHPISFSSFV